MTSGFGVDPAADGSSGTSSSDIRKIFGGLYSPGIINGCVVTTSGSTMQYTVQAGVVAIKTATSEVVLAPVPTTTIATAAAPASGTRTDIVYAQQRFPSIEGDANIVISVGTVAPARSVVLKKVIVSAGQTNTNAAVATGAIDFSIPYGASLGTLHKWQNVYSGLLSIPLLREGHGTFSVPTDRRIRLSVTALLYADGANGFDSAKYTEHYFLPNVDGQDHVIWTTPGLHQAWGTYNFEHYIDVGAGTHTCNLGAGRMVGPGRAVTFYGVDGNGYGRRGVYFQVDDAGPIL